MPKHHAFSPFSGEFLDAGLEQRFRQSIQTKTLAQLRNSLLVAAILLPLFGIIDYHTAGPGRDFYLLGAMRVVVALTALLLIVVLARKPELTERAMPLNVVLFLLISCVILVIPLRPETVNFQLTGVLGLTLVLYLFIPNRLAWMAGQCLYLATGFLLALYFWTDTPPTNIGISALVLVFPNVTGFITACRLNRGQREAFVALLGALDANEQLQREIVARSSLEAELRLLAQTDDLTGLNNRRWFLELAAQALRQARRTATPLSVLMIDMDHFKSINDSFGHSVGDTVLMQVAAQCREELRETDIIGRFGGEEFVIALPDADASNARVIAERLRARIEKLQLGGNLAALRITVTVGIAEVAENERTLDGALQRADEALYLGKREGRNTVIIAKARLSA